MRLHSLFAAFAMGLLSIHWGSAMASCEGDQHIRQRAPVTLSAQELAQLAAMPPLRVMAVGSPPLALYHPEQRRFTGMGVDVLCFIAHRLGLRFHIDPALHLTVTEKIALVQSGQADVFLPLSTTPERSQHGHFTRPIYNSHYVAIANKGQELDIEHTNDLSRYRLGVIQGVALEPILQRLIDRPEQLHTYATAFNADGLFGALRAGKVDLAVFSRDFFLEQRYNHELFDLDIVHALKEYPRRYSFYFGPQPEHALLAQLFDRYLAVLDLSSALQAHQLGERQLIERYLQQRQHSLLLQLAIACTTLLALGALLALYYHRSLSRRLTDSYRQLHTQQQALQTANQTLEKLSRTDSLTQLANRRAFDHALQREHSRQQRTGAPLSLLMLDLDFFKYVNDHYGHATGDAYLRAVAQVLGRHCSHPTDLAARYGGEEFACVLPDTPHPQAQQIAEAMRQATLDLQLPHASSPYGVLTVSMGVITLEHGPLSAAQLQEQADALLYAAKDVGRNAIVCKIL